MFQKKNYIIFTLSDIFVSIINRQGQFDLVYTPTF